LSNDTLIHEVAKNGDIEKLKILLRAGLNYLLLNNYGETPLYSAYKYLSKHYFIQVLNTFIAHIDNFDMNDDFDGSNTLLLICLIEKEYMIIDAILDNIKSINLDINYKNNDGDTALHIAIKKNVPIRIIEKLLYCGADPTIKNNDNYSLIDNHYIAYQPNDRIFIEKIR
jgi:ankyrin repeat protein